MLCADQRRRIPPSVASSPSRFFFTCQKLPFVLPTTSLHRYLVVWLACLVVGLTTDAYSQFGGSGFGGGPGAGGQGPQQPIKRKRTRVPFYGPVEKTPVIAVNIIGNSNIPTERILSMLMTRSGRVYDPQSVQRDVRTLVASGLFQDVRTFNKDVDGGKSITFQIVERPRIAYVRYVGNEKIKDKSLDDEIGIKAGGPMNRFAVEESLRSLQQLYRDKGYFDAHIELLEGTGPNDKGVVYSIHEGGVQRIFDVEFEGNSIASDARLKTQISSKPGILWYFGGKANGDAIDEDVQRLTAYYRSLGFFRAKIGRQIDYNDDRTWLSIKFIIDEGPRYRIRNVRFVGNQRISGRQLLSETEMRAGEYFNLSQMQRDLGKIRDQYGSQGYIFADIQAQPRFMEAPGEMDIVFKVDEGKQHRIGRIMVNIDGEYAHTRRSVVLNHLSIRPGDIVDVRELRASERRLQASSLFMHNPATGVTPKIVVKPQDNDTNVADQDDTIRGQSPRVSYRPIMSTAPEIDLIVKCPPIPQTEP